MVITQKLKVNLIPSGIAPRVNVSQYDYGSRTLEISLYNGTEPFMIPTGADVVIQGTKKDNRGFQYEGLEFDGNVVYADLTQQMSVFEDEVATEVVIITGTGDDKEQLATANFIINVEAAALRDNVVVSETDIPAIQTLPEAMAEVRAAVIRTEADALAASGSATEAQSYAKGGTGTRSGEDTDNALYYKNQAAGSATNAAASERNAASSETNAASSERNASTSEINAASSERNAGISETNAAGSATSAHADAVLAESYTHGGTGTREGENTDNAEYYLSETQDIVADLLQHYGVTVVGNRLVFGATFEENFTLEVIGTKLKISNIA